MHYLLAVVEGETEKGLIEAFLRTKVGQSPEKYGAIEVVPIPAGGNQGYTKLVEVAEQKINEYLLNPDNCYCDTDDDVEKWLVFDYDDIDNKRITLEELEDDAKKLGFSCVVSRPNIEFFILALLKGIDFTKKINPENYKQEINREIDSLNKKDATEKTWLNNSIKIPAYDKGIYQCRNCLLALFAFHPELVDKILQSKINTAENKYSQLPILLKRIMEVVT